MRSRGNRFRGDDEAATAVMEELPAYLVVTVAITLFVLLVTQGVLAYGSSYDRVEAGRELAAAGASILAHPDLLEAPGAPHGAFSADKVQAVAAAGDDKAVLAALGLEGRAGVRLVDVSQHATGPDGGTCRAHWSTSPDPCVLLDVAAPGGSDRVLGSWPVTVRGAADVAHAALLEVTLWR